MSREAHTAVRPAGHCDDDAAWAEFARQYHGKPRSRPDLTDFALANAVFMADRWDLDLIVYQTAAKERIRWLSLRLAETVAALKEAGAELYDLAHSSGNPADPANTDSVSVTYRTVCAAIQSATGEG